MAMAKRYADGSKIVASGGYNTGGRFHSRICTNTYQQSQYQQHAHQQPPRTSPCKSGLQQQSPRQQRQTGGCPPTSPRTSPGLLAGHYAGCKFSEPPSPRTLPLPPKHWMQTQQGARQVRVPFHASRTERLTDGAQQLKMLLKLQA